MLWRLSHTLLVFFIVSQPVWGQTHTYDPDRQFAVDSLKADLHFLRNNITQLHPGLYRYTPKAEFDQFWDSLNQVLTQPLKGQAFLSILMLLNNKIKNGHTMFLPSSLAMEYNNSHGRFFPFSVRYIQGTLIVEENNSNDPTIARGLEVVGINGMSTRALMTQLLARQIRDGYNQTYPAWILDHYFPSYYSFIFGQPDQFQLRLRDRTGEVYEKIIQALPKDSIAYFRQTRYSTTLSKLGPGQGIVLEEYKDKSTAVLKIKSFDPDLLLSGYGQDYKRTMDSLFRSLAVNKITHLILDLRNNQGGDFPPARYLLSYLALRPTQFLIGGKESRLIKPKANHFKGRLFVLTNGGSFSATVMVAAILERDKRAVFIGEETGGNKTIISGEPEEVVLPHTKIRCYLSTISYRILEGVNQGHGVLPTYTVTPTIEDVREKRDRALETAFKLISEN